MEFVNDPLKSKRVFIAMLIIAILLFVAGGVLGYFYYQKVQNYKTLRAEKQQLEDELNAVGRDAAKELKACKIDKAKLEKENQTLEEQVANYESGVKTATAYANFINYLGNVIKAHGGLQNITTAEYQQGLSLARATGNSQFVSTVEWAWNRTDVNPADRLATVLEQAAAGIIASFQ